jgi:hypothetical protein
MIQSSFQKGVEFQGALSLLSPHLPRGPAEETTCTPEEIIFHSYCPAKEYLLSNVIPITMIHSNHRLHHGQMILCQNGGPACYHLKYGQTLNNETSVKNHDHFLLLHDQQQQWHDVKKFPQQPISSSSNDTSDSSLDAVSFADIVENVMNG